MTHTVAVGEFEGPLGILLDLVERGRLEVTAISVAEITENYLGRIKQLGPSSPEALSEFLQLGARLLYIKSLALLPQPASEEQTEELRQLNLELEEYSRLQAAARELARRGSLRSWHRTATDTLPPQELPLPKIELSQLAEAFTRALKRLEPERSVGVIQHHVSLETVSHRIREHLGRGSFDLQSLLDNCHDRLEAIVTFLALLELIREGAAQVTQANQFAPINVEPAGA
ncbi:MAG TPA: ScpA family protein [Candidatus Saccharimonadia bacterium]|jgi:segregation and condensation protein A